MCICTIDFQKSVIARCLAEGSFKSPQEKHQDAKDFSEQQHSWQMEFRSLKTKV